VDDDAPMTDTPDTQREDALPDQEAGGTGSRNRRRGRRGTGSSSPQPDTEDAPKSERSGGRGPSSEKSLEAHIAAGGSTRGIRSSRSRTGRVGGRDGRRRREPMPTPPRITDKLMVITEHGDRDQIAVLEEATLVQHYVTRTGAMSMVGNVYLGRVQNVLPGMEAAFVDIGRGRNGVLYAGEVNYTPEDLEGPAPRIEQVLKAGQAVMVQVTKDPMGGKGARLTAQVSMPGRFLVLAPDQAVSGISRRLPDEERKRLKGILKKVRPERHGIIVRTAAEGASEEALTTDLKRLVREWDEINHKAKKAKAPAVLYEEPELTVRVFRDLFNDEEYKGLVTDSQPVYDKIMRYVNEVAPDLAPKIKLHSGKLPAFEEHRIVEQIHKALDRKVWLPSGGYLIIERTEAMTIVDVNTGKAVGKTNLEETVKNTNLEAAAEVGRQLRLRDIGGIIVIDFIDMLLEKNKKQVEDTMRDALAIDKTRSQVFEIGPLGLMQVTRKRVSGGLVESFSETCPTCEGRGILVNYEA
jgi:ribonuclease E